MVEHKISPYDETNPPFAEALPAEGHHHHEDLLVVEATSADEQDQEDSTSTMNEASGSTSTSRETQPLVPAREISDEEDMRNQRTIGAGVASGLFGTLIGGPVLGVIFGFGAAYFAGKDDDDEDGGGATSTATDAARAIGDLALNAKEKAEEIDRKHDVVGKAKVAASGAWEKAQDLDRQHRILDRTKNFLAASFTALTDFVKRHNLVERGVAGVGAGLEWVAKKISEKLESPCAAANNSADGDGRKQ